jgi:RNA polymerase sigma-70 factor, ECF subfamily
MNVNCNENEKDFIELYKKYFPKIYNYIYRKFFNKEIAEDLTSNTFFKALDFIKKNNPEIKNFNAWLYKIATNEINMHLRYMKDKKNLSIDDNESSLIISSENSNEGALNKFIDFMALKNALVKLNVKEQNIIEMHFFENLDYREISEILDIRESSLRSIIHRALKKIENLIR